VNTTELVLVDLSSLAYPIYLTTQSDSNPNKASQEIVARVRALASDHPHAAICCDSGRSFRHDLAAEYKANRPEREAPLHHQIKLAMEQLQADGFPVWSARGFEADDLIATATKRALDIEGASVLIVTGDKDLLQLVGPRVRAKSARDGSILDEAGVEEKFHVKPAQLRDYLALVGDKSDNIKGAVGIGTVKAVQLLSTFESLDACYEALAKGEAVIPAAVKTALLDFKPRMETTRALVTLRTDVEIPFEEISAPRAPKDLGFAPMDDEPSDESDSEDEHERFREVMHAASAPRASGTLAGQPSIPNGADSGRASVDAVTDAGAVSRLPQTDAAASVPDAGGSGSSNTGLVRAVSGEIVPTEYERQLDPRSLKDARVLAEDMYKSTMFSSYGSPQGVLSTVMVGRELGLPAMASLRSIHNIDGRHGLSASLMVALVLKSGMAEYFEPISFSDREATYETKRKGARNPVRLTHTIEMGWQAWPKGKATDQKKIEEARAAFDASGWGRNPTDMLVARATSRLARMVYPDLLAGLYTPEELAEIRDNRQGAA
jgi:5'-3' exonuclease